MLPMIVRMGQQGIIKNFNPSQIKLGDLEYIIILIFHFKNLIEFMLHGLNRYSGRLI